MTAENNLIKALQAAVERAAIEVETWIPENIGDHYAGEVIEIGSITTTYGTVATTIHNTFDGKKFTGELVRVAWMGAVLEAQFQRMQPSIGDLCAFHYQKDIEPKSGMNAYKLINAVVIDGKTGEPKIPANMRIAVPTDNDIANADPATGEIKVGRSPLDPIPGEEPF